MKNEILNELKQNQGKYVSGGLLSGKLSVSRTAIWKHITELKNDGYVIESSSKKGYKLISSQDILNACEISYNLNTEFIGKNIIYLDSVDSTNNYAKKIAAEGCCGGTTVVAENQTAGRGRLGRAWDSADKKGIWMSVVLRPSVPPQDVQIITIAASVAVSSAIAKFTGIRPGIKWPNDIILDAKKVCGILAEISSEIERVNFLVLGIGINVNQEPEDFCEEIKHTAVSLKVYAGTQGNAEFGEEGQEHLFNRSELIKGILYELERVYYLVMAGDITSIITEWKEYSVTLGKKIKVTIRDAEYIGVAEDITADGKLVVRCDDGEIREVVSGEVSVRGILGYV